MVLATASAAAPLSVVPSGPANPGFRAILVGQDTLPNSGTVTESIDAGQYTYLHVTRDGQGTWLAIPQRDVPVGTEIHYRQGMVMKDFHSASLDRTFETVLFLGDIQVAGETPAPAGHPPVTSAPVGQGDLPNGGKVTESIAAGQYTYLQVTEDGKRTSRWTGPSRRCCSSAASRWPNSRAATRFRHGVPRTAGAAAGRYRFHAGRKSSILGGSVNNIANGRQRHG
jgi:hypothetical protein